MKTKSWILSVASACLWGMTLWMTPASASQMSVSSFPDELILSEGDNRIIAFVASKDGERVADATVRLKLLGIGGKLDQDSCQTDDSGKCLFSYTAARELGEGEIEASAFMPDAAEARTYVSIKVVSVPDTQDSGWQCEGKDAVFTAIEEKMSCSAVCSVAKDCAGSPCASGSGKYCYSAEEACACTKTDPDAQGRTKGATTTAVPAAGTGTGGSGCKPGDWRYCNPLAGTIDSLKDAGIKSIQALLGLIGTIGLLLLIIAGITYMTAAGSEEKIKQAKKIVTGTIVGLAIALISYSLLETVSKIMEVKEETGQ